MLNILHGKNTVASRNFLNSFIAQAQNKNLPIVRITSADFQIDSLINALEPDLFSQKKLIILDDFQSFSLQSQREIASLTKKIFSENQLIIWANKEMSKKVLALFPPQQDRLFKPDNLVFTFLDSLSPDNKEKCLKLLNQALEKTELGLVFHLLIGRIEDLTIIKTGHQDQLKKAPWQKKQLFAQAQNFSLPQLKKLLKGLIALDYQQKTGQLFYSLEFGLELLILKL